MYRIGSRWRRMQVTEVLHLHDSQSLDSQRVAVLYTTGGPGFSAQYSTW